MKSLLNLRYHNRYRSSLINNIRKRPNTRCPKPLCGAPRPRLQLHRAPTVVSRCSTRISYRQYATWSDTKAKLKQYYNMTQEMLTFYRNAAIQIYHNHKTAWPLMQLYMRSIPLSRKDTRFVQRHIRDLSCIIPFIFVWLLPGSAVLLPLMVKYLPGLLPSTFIDDNQKKQFRLNRLQARKETVGPFLDFIKREYEKCKVTFEFTSEEQTRLSALIQSIEAKQEISVEDLQICHDTLSKIVDVDSLDREGLVLLSRILSTWNRGLPSPFIRIGIKDRIDRLKSDDKLVIAEGGESSLTDEEVIEATDERGLPTNLPISESRRQLANWFKLSSANTPLSVSILYSISSINTSPSATTTGTENQTPNSQGGEQKTGEHAPADQTSRQES